jgi:hypothetical protein
VCRCDRGNGNTLLSAANAFAVNVKLQPLKTQRTGEWSTAARIHRGFDATGEWCFAEAIEVIKTCDIVRRSTG